MHACVKSDQIPLIASAVYAKHSEGYTQASLIDRSTGSVHTGLSLNVLASGGTIFPHLHSYEKGFYLLDGEVELSVAGRCWRLVPGDFGAFKVGTLHAWRNSGQRPARWLQMGAPQPKPFGLERDTFFARQQGTDFSAPKPLDENDLNGALLGHFDASQIPAGPTRDALPGMKGVFLKWLVDEKFGARHHRLVFIEYQPGASIALHDHTFEESYFLMSGEIEGIMDGKRYIARAGDVLWTGVGCVHTFTNISNEPVRWLETFAPQPPAENVFRFMAEWEQRAKDLKGPDVKT